MEALQSVIDFGNSVASKVSPGITYVSEKVSGFIDVSPENIHLLILGGISMYIAHIIAGRELKLKFWIISGALWFLFKYLGF